MRRCLVMCHDINEKRYNVDSYKAPDNKYYSSEEAYSEIMKKRNKIKNDRNICIDKISDLLGYDGMPMPTITFKKIEELSAYGYDVIAETIDYKIKDIEWALNHKMFKSETNKIQYIFAIIQNSCKEVLDKKLREEKIKRREDEKEDMQIFDIECIGTKKKGNDISSLLGEDDWI